MAAGPTSTIVSKTTFRLEFSLTIHILASPEKVWNVLTNAADYHKWNTTVLSLEGKIGYKEEIRIRTILDTNRPIGLTVSEFDPPTRMAWSDGIAPLFRGVRRSILTPCPDGSTDLVRSDTFSGILLPLIGQPLEQYKTIFDKFAVEIKMEAEKDLTSTLN